MVLSLAAILLTVSTATVVRSPIDTIPADRARAVPAALVASAYLDPGARALVRSARERRTTVEGSITRYQTIARARISAGVHAMLRDRLMYRCESVAHVDWRRSGPVIVKMLGGREAVPIVSRDVDAEESDCLGEVFDPADDHLRIGDVFNVNDSSAFARHPLGTGSEAYYRFASGDTTRIRLPDGRTITIIELRVIPRRADPHLVSGSLWLDQDSHALVRAVLRLAKPWSLKRDSSDLVLGPNSDESDDGLPAFVPDVRADIRYFSVEYGLFGGRWWLPRRIAFDGEAQIGSFVRFPLEIERTYSDYQVEGGQEEASPLQALMAASPRCGDRSGEPDSASAVQEGEADSVAASLVPHPAGTNVELGCECRDGDCRVVATIIPADSAALINSPYLPASIFDDDENLLSEADVNRILDQVKQSAPVPWQLARPGLDWGFSALGLTRYNRVEGLTLGARSQLDLGRAVVDGSLRLGLANLRPSVEVGARAAGLASEYEVNTYYRLDAVGFDDGALSIGNSLDALLFGRDDGDYFRSVGAEFTRDPTSGVDGLSWRLFAEHQSAVEKQTDFSFANVFGDADFRENIQAEKADQVGLAATFRTSRGLNPAGWRGSAGISLEGQAGSFNFAKPSLDLLGTAPLPGDLVGSLGLATGTTLGTAPVQSLWYLGGPGTVRGYTGNWLAGEAFWRGRVEVATATPGARLVLFSDVGWAGPRGDYLSSPPLLSAGVGGSVFDGLLRLDLSRTLRAPIGWRLDLHVDAPL